ncbi:hypothetical protein [Thermoactinospora rubra]|nr:hypothetical protein [Thermoactinospora rubra]
MSSTPAPEPWQERKPRKKIVIRRLGKTETATVVQPSGGNSN